jgi:thiamine biosynthesis lipoprotein
MSRTSLRRGLGLLVAGLAGVAMWGVERPGAEAEPAGFVTFRGAAMATTIAVTLPAGPAAAEHAAAVLAVFREVEARMSEWKDTSPLAAVNRAAGVRPVAVPEDLRQVLHRARRIGEATDGAFDVTWAALWGLWDFKAAEPRLPPPGEVARRAALVDFRQLEIDDAAGTVFLPRAGMMLGLGGIAKGHALDRAAAVLAARGVDDYLIAAGGQVMARGDRGGRPWRVGIRDPRGGPEDVFARVEVRDASLSTSGDYESFFVVDGVRYHHILDPRTGMPARGLRSATVVAADATLADALSTALIALGAERGLAVAERLGVEAVLVDEEGRVAVTAGLAGVVGGSG